MALAGVKTIAWKLREYKLLWCAMYFYFHTITSEVIRQP